jgi:hypothetical protein
MYPWQRERYPDNWEKLSLACKAMAKWRCEKCSIAEGTWRIGRNGAYQERLQAAHVDHDPENLNPRLMALCQACHLRNDASENAKKMRQTKCRKHYDAELAAGQLELFVEEKLEERELA